MKSSKSKEAAPHKIPEKFQFKKRLRILRRDLVSSIRAAVKSMKLEFYSSGYVDKKHSTGRIQLAQLPHAVTYRGRDARHKFEIKHLTETGFVECAHGGGAIMPDWEHVEVEELISINSGMRRLAASLKKKS